MPHAGNEDPPESEAIRNLFRFSVVELFSAGVYTVTLVSSGQATVVSSAITLTLQFVAAYFLWVGMGYLASTDKPSFRTPRILTLAQLVGFPIFAVGIAYDYHLAASFNPAQVDVTEILAALTILLLGGTAVIVGIVGAALGLWRTGTKYSNISIKQGSVLFFLPYVSLIGAGLLFRGFWNVHARQQPRPYSQLTLENAAAQTGGALTLADFAPSNLLSVAVLGIEDD